jgi:cellulose synthase operon protein C
VTARPTRTTREQVSHEVRERLERLKSAPRAQITPDRWAYREAAALLFRFDPTELQAVGQVDGSALLHLLDDCVSIGDPSRGQWTLKPDVRVDALRRLHGRDDALRALGANPGRSKHGVELTAESYLRGIAPSLETQSPQQLRHSLQAARWLAEIPGLDGIPRIDDVAAILRSKQLFEPLEALVGEAFYGRASDLSELRLHVGVLQPATLSTKLRRVAQKANPVGGDERAPMMVFGPPGIGKSTLLAKFVLDHARSPDKRIPFVYADFERPTLSIMEPTTLLAEAARQLASQFPAAVNRLDSLADQAEQETIRQRAAQTEVDELADVSAARGTVRRTIIRELRMDHTARERALIDELVDALKEALSGTGREAPPLLVVLDSFERAQYRSSPYLRRIWDILGALQNDYPMVRMVVSGRAPVEELSINQRPANYHRVAEFDPDARIGFLRSYGVEDPEVASLLAAHFGGNPLSLKLAAKIANREKWDTQWLSDVPTRRLWLLRISDLQIQARLYDRLLGSLHDQDVARLAHPGLVLRRITPELIREVLAEPCGVEVGDQARADALFEAFADQLDLVYPEEDGALSHRPDVRRDMLPLVEGSNPRAAEEIERRAVTYHARQPTLVSRAEEIYHRLRLGEPPRSVEERWEPGVERYLEWAPPEVPARAQAYLAAKLTGGSVPPGVLAEAELAEWEQLTARQVEDLLEQTGSDEAAKANAAVALKLMGERSGRSAGSPLYGLEAEALALVGRRELAERTVDEGISSIRGDLGSPSTAAVWDTLLDLLILGARFLHDRGKERMADLQLAEAEHIAERLGRGLDVLGTQLMRIRLRRAGDADAEGAQAVRKQASRRFLALDDAELRDRSTVVRSVVEELAGEDKDVLIRAIDLLGVAPSDPPELDALAAHIGKLMATDAEFAAWLQDYAARRGVRLQDAAGVRELLERLMSTGRLEELARALVAQSSPNDETCRLLIAMLSGPPTRVDLSSERLTRVDLRSERDG